MRWVFLSVCLSVALLSDKVWENDFAQKALDLRSGFGIIGYGKVCSCVPTFNVVPTPLGGASIGCRIWEWGKTWGLSPFTGDRINWSGRNLACKCTLWVCFSVANLTMIGSGVGYRTPPPVNIMYSTAAAQNRSLLKIRPQVSSLTRNFTFSRYLGVNKEKKSMCLKCWSIKVTFFLS